jgi:hypothetical protein
LLFAERIVILFLFAVGQKPNAQVGDEIWTNATARCAAKNELAPHGVAQTAFFAGALLALICCQISSMPFACLVSA